MVPRLSGATTDQWCYDRAVVLRPSSAGHRRSSQSRLLTQVPRRCCCALRWDRSCLTRQTRSSWRRSVGGGDHGGFLQVGVAVSIGRRQCFVSGYEAAQPRFDLVEVREVCLACGTTLRKLAEPYERSLKALGRQDRWPGWRLHWARTSGSWCEGCMRRRGEGEKVNLALPGKLCRISGLHSQCEFREGSDRYGRKK